ncbi:MAG: PmoA family protein [Planctomycetes bacterium]|nr:PmoA family protein [Planctomycetota bacterium]
MMKSRYSSHWIITCVVSVTVLAITSQAAPKAPRIGFVAQPRMIVIKADNQPLATYVYNDPEILRPYFKDIHAPGGIQISRFHPPREGVDPTDHAHLHPGLWLAFGDLSGADFWRNRAQVKHVEFVVAPHATAHQGSFTVRNRYIGDGKILCEETCEYTFLVRSTGILILWHSTFRSDQNNFWFGDQEEMGLGVRVATPIMVNSKQGGRIIDDQGRKDEKGIWGKQAQWCDYSGWINGSFVGITIMPDPGNFRPCWWHTRNYGFMAANPFGRAAFGAGPASKVRVNRGEPFRLSYGILLHANKNEEALDLPIAYQDYLTVLQQTQEETKQGGQR